MVGRWAFPFGMVYVKGARKYDSYTLNPHQNGPRFCWKIWQDDKLKCFGSTSHKRGRRWVPGIFFTIRVRYTNKPLNQSHYQRISTVECNKNILNTPHVIVINIMSRSWRVLVYNDSVFVAFISFAWISEESWFVGLLLLQPLGNCVFDYGIFTYIWDRQ